MQRCVLGCRRESLFRLARLSVGGLAGLLGGPLRRGDLALHAIDQLFERLRFATKLGRANTDVVIRDPLPAMLANPTATVTGGTGSCAIEDRSVACTFPALAAGATAAIRIEADVAADTAGTLLRNVGTVAGAERPLAFGDREHPDLPSDSTTMP